MIKALVQKALASVGYELRRKRVETPAVPRASVEGALAQVKALGWQPATVIDVGAAYGTFSKTCHSFFPGARLLLIEPLEEYRASLETVCSEIPAAILEQVACGATDGTVTLHVHKDWEGSSLYHESEGDRVDGSPRTVPLRRLDALCAKHKLTGPILLKVDTQSAELDVLAGGENTLAQADYVVLEVSLFKFFIGGPEFFGVLAFMKERGWVMYDYVWTVYRLVDNALAQMDLVFVKENGQFRHHHLFALPEQRAAQDAWFEQRQQTRSLPTRTNSEVV